jgi:hypothetical protein
MAKKKKDTQEPPKKTLTFAEAYQESLTDADKQYYRDLLGQIGKDDKTIAKLTEAQAKQYEQQFGSLAKSVLDETVNKIKNRQKKAQEFEMLSGMSGLSEIFGMGESLANSLLGDSGIGGFLSMTGGDSKEASKKLKEQISGIGGISTNNITAYNWQKWFDGELTKSIEKAATSGIKDEKELEAARAFANDYVENYLRPRFDFSKSMSEFSSYLQTDLSQPEFIQEVIDRQRIQTAFTELKDKRAKQYLNELTNQGAKKFDADFYFNPTGDDAKATTYANQTEKVNRAWERAKQGKNSDGINWTKAAYEYGLDLNNKEQFAKLHYELYGKANEFDGAADIITKASVKDFINNNIIPELKKTQYDPTKGVFKNYVSPEETADGILSDLTGGRGWDQYVADVLGIKPPKDPGSAASEEEKNAYRDAVASYNSRIESLKEQVGDDPLNQIRDEILDFYYNQGEQSIRSQIKKLQEKNIVPTQKELGVEYIERDIDKPTRDAKKETALYKMFKDSGYGGDEDTFYTEMFPDVSREEQESLTNLLSGPEGFKKFFDISDPFSFDPDKMFSAFDVLDSKKKEDETQATKDTYFTLDSGIGTGQVGIGTSKQKPKSTSDLRSDFDFGGFGFF